MADLDDFTKAYIEAALWSSTDDQDRPMDENYSMDDIAPELMERIKADCERFQTENADLMTDENCDRLPGECTVIELAGHDFWLTQNGHGCGFWDGDWTKDAGRALTEASKAYGSVDLYVGDDGRIYA